MSHNFRPLVAIIIKLLFGAIAPNNLVKLVGGDRCYLVSLIDKFNRFPLD
ncbi:MULTISPECIES: hypothetical protein [Planktothricoides]|uniref:Transposase n=1 Tax=Planktothricoides raciborskii FACHB-1370 TaxID=2949576 RepID=A0ABR8EJP3_9CYAN|nr:MULTISPECIES: hypothetical protein [Planktothricoides]MBD2546740.1 hypothetical protein [Planktothricoides raciborskii FACHB-1370]MBD2585472.1 hypothetical protein [Planktothricoides raciborskii FACHB-1261]